MDSMLAFACKTLHDGPECILDEGRVGKDPIAQVLPFHRGEGGQTERRVVQQNT